MKKKAQNKEMTNKDVVDDWDFSAGFGGIPDDIDLSKNIGCASNSPKKKRKKEDWASGDPNADAS